MKPYINIFMVYCICFILSSIFAMEKQNEHMCEKLFFRCPEGKDGLTNRITGFVLSLTNKCLCKLWVDSDVKVDYKPWSWKYVNKFWNTHLQTYILYFVVYCYMVVLFPLPLGYLSQLRDINNGAYCLSFVCLCYNEQFNDV